MTKKSIEELNICERAIDRDKGVKIHRQHMMPVKWNQAITRTDLYDVLIAFCGTSSKLGTLTGTVDVLNPYGRLDGTIYPCLYFSLTALGLYILVLYVWGLLLAGRWNTLVPLQKYYFTAFLLLCAVEQLLIYLNLNYVNNHGHTSLPLYSLGLVGFSARTSQASVLVLLVCTRYGITMPLLKWKPTITVFTIVYAVLVMLIGVSADISSDVRILLAIPAAGFSIIIGCLYAFGRNQLELARERQTYELCVFRQLLMLFVVVGFCYLVLIIAEIIYIFSQEAEDYWQISWIFLAAPEGILFLQIAGVVTLWRPNAGWIPLAEDRKFAAPDTQGIELHQIDF